MTPGKRVRRILMEYLTGTWSFTGWGLGPVFPVMSGFLPYSKLKVFLFVPGRNDSTNWGGGYIELQYSINGGTWVSTGSCGHDAGVMHYSASSIGSYANNYVFDFEVPTEYSIQFRLYCTDYDTTYTINGSNDINSISGTAAYHPNNANTGQHYCHIIVEELV